MSIFLMTALVLAATVSSHFSGSPFLPVCRLTLLSGKHIII